MRSPLLFIFSLLFGVTTVLFSWWSHRYDHLWANTTIALRNTGLLELTALALTFYCSFRIIELFLRLFVCFLSFSLSLFPSFFLSSFFFPLTWSTLALNLSFLKDIPGNKDASSLVEYKFKEPFITSVVRINPSSSPNDPICLRAELYGCDPNPGNLLFFCK